MSISKVVLKIGGSILFPSIPFDTSFFGKIIRDLSDFIIQTKRINKDAKIAIVIGGGKTAREYIKLARETGLSTYIQDLIGIETSRLNALVILNSVKKNLIDMGRRDLADKISSSIPRSSLEAINLFEYKDILFIGGFFPGQSTIGPAALTAEGINADLFLIATNVKGVYSADPNTDPGARKIKCISPKELKDLLSKYENMPGTYKVMDLVAITVLERSRIPTIIFDGRDLSNATKVLINYVEGKFEEIEEIGTIIS